MRRIRLGVDTGGTFTDFVVLDDDGIRVHKVLSTPEAPERAILQGIRELGLEAAMQAGHIHMVHGSTVATNAALENKGVPVAWVTNAGFEDILTIGRQARRTLYDFRQAAEAPPVPRSHCIGVAARMDARGQEVVALSADEVAAVIAAVRDLGVRAVAICFLFSWQNPEHEQRLAEALRRALPDVFVCASHEVLPEIQEYERGMATWMNAWLGPVVRGYLQRLRDAVAPSRVDIMQSSAGVGDVDQVADRAVNLLLSGPAGGLAAAQAVQRQLALPGMLTFDMGGTSTDVAMLQEGLTLTRDGRIRDWPVAVPMVDMHTIGAGGGSLIWLDAGGMLQVGPESAGALPGPACYGRGGMQPTITDAHVVLGTLPAFTRLGGHMTVDVDAARRAFAPLAAAMQTDVETVAAGALAIATEHMAQALRVISLYRGHDPRAYALCCFGGAGGLHVCDLAEALGMQRAVVPEMAGVLSALGMLAAPREYVLTHSVNQPWPPDEQTRSRMRELRETLVETGRRRLGHPEAEVRVRLHLRYVGQTHALVVPADDWSAVSERFREAHQSAYGFVMNRPIECVSMEVAVREASPSLTWPVTVVPGRTPQFQTVHGQARPVPVWPRQALAPGQTLSGPAIVTDAVGTLWLKPGWILARHALGHLQLRRDG